MILLETAVRAEWIDYNGHLYDGFYAVVFAQAADAFLLRVGLDEATRTRTRHTIYTLETHVRFLREVKLDAPLVVSGRVLEADAKRARLFLDMRDTGRDILAATSEQLLMSIDQSGDTPRSAPWLGKTRTILDGLLTEGSGEPWPEAAGRGIALKR